MRTFIGEVNLYRAVIQDDMSYHLSQEDKYLAIPSLKSANGKLGDSEDRVPDFESGRPKIKSDLRH